MGVFLPVLNSNAQSTKAAAYQLHIQLVDKDSFFNLQPLKIQTGFANKGLCSSYINELVALLSSKGYPTASVDSIFEKEAVTTIHLFLGKQYQWIKLTPDGIEKARRDAHLGGGVNREIRDDLPRKPHEADILHDQSIDSRLAQQAKVVCRVVEFRGKDEGIESNVSFHAVPMAVRDDLREFRLGEVIRTQARVEAGQAKVNRVRSVGHGCTHAVPIARGREQLRSFGAVCDGGGHRLGGRIKADR
jgi:hypothetical protein